MKNKIVLITVFHSFITKNFLNTDAFKKLTTIPNTEYILVVPSSKKDFFSEIYKANNINIIGVDTLSITKNRVVGVFSIFSHLLLKSHYLWYKKVERRDSSKSLLKYPKYYTEVLFTLIFGNFKPARYLFRYLFINLVKIKNVSKIFDEYKPDLVFSTDVFDEMDLLFSAEAKRRGVYCVGMVRSWDNCYSKGVLRVLPKKLYVNNEVLRDEAIEMHDVSSSDIQVCGLPQYDHFINDQRSSRVDFFNKIGADISKRLILFAPAGTILSDADSDVCDILKKAIVNNKMLEPTQVLVRNHPHHPAVLDMYIGDKDLIIDNPGMRIGNNPKEAELTKSDTIHLGDSLCYSDIIIYTATTLGIDSLIFNKPQIIIDFDGYKNKKYTQSVRRYHNEDHMKKMIDCGGVWVVSSEDELIEAINAYYKNPDMLKEGREEIKKKQIQFMDGKSSDRLAGFIKEAIQSV